MLLLLATFLAKLGPAAQAASHVCHQVFMLSLQFFMALNIAAQVCGVLGRSWHCFQSASRPL